MHEIPHTQNVEIQDHINSLNLTKPWFKLLQFPLQDALKMKEHHLSIYARRLLTKALDLSRWCIPNLQIGAPVVQYHVKLHAPCGYVQISSEIKENYTSWKIDIPLKLRVQVHFHIFEMDVSHRGCEQSAFYLAYHDFSVSEWILPDEWIFCGYRKPWYETAPSSTVSMLLRHRNVQQRSNITFTYTSLEIEVASIYIMHANNSQHMILYPISVAYTLQRSQFVQTWILVVEYGYRIEMPSLLVCCSSNTVIIYDGFQETFSVRYKEDSAGERYHRYLDLHSNYFQIILYFHVYELNYLQYDSILLKATFERSFLQVKQATIDSNSTIANNGSILYVAYSLKMASNEKLYPNVSFNVRRFHGWNDGNCKFGGYLLVEAKYYLDDVGNYKFGPFCSKSFPTEPFVGTHGPKNIIFGKHELYIILYAFGPLYALDIDLIVVPSVCEGVFELPYSCLNSSRKQQNVVNHDNHNYQVQCSNTILGGIHEVLFAKFTFLTVVDCIIIQSIGYSRFEEEHYEILSTVNVKVTATHALPFLPLGEIDGKSRAFLSLHGVRTDFYNISHLNSSFKTTAQNILLFKLRLFQFNTHQRRAFSIYINASVKNSITCSNSSNGQEHVGIIKGKLYKAITITSICGFMLLKSTGVFIIRFHPQLPRFYGEIKYIEITKQGSNRDSTSDKQDTLTLAYEERGVSHTVGFTSQTVRLDIHRSFGLIVEKSISNVTFKLNYRIEIFKIYSKIGYMLITDNRRGNVITVSDKDFRDNITFL